MATNNNLQSIRLGAPTSIEVENQYPHAALTVQTMELCHTLTLHDAADGTRCTDEGAMVTAARLLTQLMHERSITENAEGWNITFDVRALVDAAVYGGADHPVPMSLTGADGAAVCWAVEGDATPGVSLTPDGVLTLPAGCTDTLRIKAIRWDDREVRAMTTIPVSDWREVDDLLVQYPQLAVVLAERPSLAAVVASYPNLAARIANEKQYVNDSLAMSFVPWSASAEAWTDEISKMVLANSGVTLDANNIPTFIAGAYYGSNDTIDLSTSSSTIEIVFVRETTTSQQSFFASSKNGTIGFIYYGSKYQGVGENGATVPMWVPKKGINELTCVGIAGSSAVENGEALTQSGTDYWGANGYSGTRIGRSRNNFVGKIAEIRIHSRLLSADELKHNQELDMLSYSGIL